MFFDDLKQEAIKPALYERAQIVWNKFNCNTLLDYHKLYLISDVLLLADVWEISEKHVLKYMV